MMKHKIFALMFLAFLFGCKSNPNKAEKIQTEIEKSEVISGSQVVGVKEGNLVVLDKAAIGEKLRDLQNSVYQLEDKVYGTRKLGSLGLYGELKSCKRKQASRQFGGAGSLIWTEPLDRVTDKEDEQKIGFDEKNQLVGVSEEFLKSRIARFQNYKQILQKRSDEFEEKISTCKTEIAAKEMDANQSSKVIVSEASKVSADRLEISKYLCSYVRSGASFKSLMVNIFSKGWLALSDFKLEQGLISNSVKDSKGVSRDNAMLFNGWKLAFDRGGVTVGEILNEGKDATLKAWAFDGKLEGVDGKCLSSSEGAWNQ